MFRDSSTQARRTMKNLLWILAAMLILTGCDNIEEAAKTAGRDPSQLLYLYAMVNCTIAFLLFFFGNWSLYISILQSIRISSVLCVIAGPILFITQESSRSAIGVGAAGLMGLAAITIAFWKDLYPNVEYRNTRAHEEEDEERDDET